MRENCAGTRVYAASRVSCQRGAARNATATQSVRGAEPNAEARRLGFRSRGLSGPRSSAQQYQFHVTFNELVMPTNCVWLLSL